MDKDECLKLVDMKCFFVVDVSELLATSIRTESAFYNFKQGGLFMQSTYNNYICDNLWST